MDMRKNVGGQYYLSRFCLLKNPSSRVLCIQKNEANKNHRNWIETEIIKGKNTLRMKPKQNSGLKAKIHIEGWTEKGTENESICFSFF